MDTGREAHHVSFHVSVSPSNTPSSMSSSENSSWGSGLVMYDRGFACCSGNGRNTLSANLGRRARGEGRRARRMRTCACCKLCEVRNLAAFGIVSPCFAPRYDPGRDEAPGFRAGAARSDIRHLGLPKVDSSRFEMSRESGRRAGVRRGVSARASEVRDVSGGWISTWRFVRASACRASLRVASPNVPCRRMDSHVASQNHNFGVTVCIPGALEP